MGIRGNLLLAAASFVFLSLPLAHAEVFPAATPLPSNAWSRVAQPTAGSPLSYGFYSYGCISGALPLPQTGTGFQVMRPFRNRYYGQPELLNFIQNLSKTLETVGSGILIGDMGQPRGGPLPYGHASHQVGLDVDIWFWTHPEQNIRTLTLDERNNLPMPTVLNANGLVDESKFTKEHIFKLKAASLSPGVERIFVNPAIKTYLCSKLPTSELYWLHHLRPWPGHDDHFHVRLSCPATSKDCIHQEAQAAGDGCTEVMPNRGKLDLASGDLDESTMSPEIEQLLVGTEKKSQMPAICSKILVQKP